MRPTAPRWTRCAMPIRPFAPMSDSDMKSLRCRGSWWRVGPMDDFFVMVGGGAAALAGLIFVALSINPEGIVRNATHRNRAINMLSGFSAIFMACGLALIRDQPPL